MTPCMQVLKEVLKNPEDKTEITFIFANVTEEDILLRKELDSLTSKHKNFKVHYLLNNPPKDWKGLSGSTNAEVIKKYLPPPSSDTLIAVYLIR